MWQYFLPHQSTSFQALLCACPIHYAHGVISISNHRCPFNCPRRGGREFARACGPTAGEVERMLGPWSSRQWTWTRAGLSGDGEGPVC